MQIYWNIGSQPGRAVKTLIDLGKIPCTLISIDILGQEYKSQSYRQVYSLGKIPVLKRHDFILGESSAILVYLCETHPQLNKYYGQNIQKRAIVNQYLSWYQNYFRHALFKPVRLYLTALIRKTAITEWQLLNLTKNMDEAVQTLDHILHHNSHINPKHTYIAGDTITIADLVLFYQITNLRYFGRDYASYPNVKRWMELILQVQEVNLVQIQWQATCEKLQSLFPTVPVIKSKL